MIALMDPTHVHTKHTYEDPSIIMFELCWTTVKHFILRHLTLLTLTKMFTAKYIHQCGWFKR